MIPANLGKRRQHMLPYIVPCPTIMKSQSCCCPFPPSRTFPWQNRAPRALSKGHCRVVFIPWHLFPAFRSWPQCPRHPAAPLLSPAASQSPPRSQSLLLETHSHKMIQVESITQHLVHIICISQPAILPISQSNGY